MELPSHDVLIHDDYIEEWVRILVPIVAALVMAGETNVEDERAELLPDGSLRIFVRLEEPWPTPEMIVPPGKWMFKN